MTAIREVAMAGLARWAAAFALTMLAAACQAPIEGPAGLGEPGDAPIEPRILGLWHAAYDEDGERIEIALMIAPRTGTPYADVLLSYADASREAEGDVAKDWRRFGWFHAEAYATKLDGRIYYTVRRLPGSAADYTPKEAQAGLMVARVTFSSGGDMTIEGLSGERVKQYAPAYGAHLSDWPIEGSDTFRWLDASKDELGQIIRAVGPDNLFAERWGPFRKVEDGDLADFQVKQP